MEPLPVDKIKCPLCDPNDQDIDAVDIHRNKISYTCLNCGAEFDIWWGYME